MLRMATTNETPPPIASSIHSLEENDRDVLQILYLLKIVGIARRNVKLYYCWCQANSRLLMTGQVERDTPGMTASDWNAY